MPAPITLLNKGNLVPHMGESQSDLDELVPLQYIMDWIGNKLSINKATSMSDRVIVLRARTGSGKSSSIPTGIYLHHFNKYHSTVLCTEPRVLTTVDIPRDISLIDAYKTPNKNGLSIELFRNLGYQTQEFTRKPKERGVLFCTTGILLQLLKTLSDDKFCKRYRFVIIDEAHDRSLDVDLILLMMKRLIKRTMGKRPPFLILMSATLNVEQYCKYFETKTVFDVKGQTKPIETIYPQIDVSDIYGKTYEIISKLDEYEQQYPSPDTKKGIRDVIVFMPAVASIKRMIQVLSKLNQTLKNKILPLSITSDDINGGSNSYRLLMEDYTKIQVIVNGDMVPAYRRVIVSTNVAETGLTLDYLKYCIDTALQFTNEFNPRYGTNIMMIKPTTSSMSLQRKGRVGRKFAGVFYPLFTEETFNSMIVDNTPSILVEDMTAHILALLASEGVSSIDRLPIYDMLTTPSEDSVKFSLEKLFVLGLIDSEFKVTEMGHMVNKFKKLPIEIGKMILSGVAIGISLKELVCMATMINFRKNQIIMSKMDTGIVPLETSIIMEEIYHTNKTFSRESCDSIGYNRLKAKLLIGCEMIEMLLIYESFASKARVLSIGNLIKWCAEKGLNYRTLCAVTESIDDVYWTLMEYMKINPVRDQTEHDEIYQILKRSEDIDNTELIERVIALKKCIYEGYKNNLLIWDKSSNTYKTRAGIDVSVPSKLVSRLGFQKLGAAFEQEYPSIIVYKELLTRTDRTGRFVNEASTISVMDGFVNVDIDFNSY